MLSFFLCFILSILTSYGMAVILVEKRFEWPIRIINVNLRLFLRRWFGHKMQKMPKCSICLSFWTALISDLIILSISLYLGKFYFFWPLSGFATAGLTWTIYEFMSILDNNNSEHGI